MKKRLKGKKRVRRKKRLHKKGKSGGVKNLASRVGSVPFPSELKTTLKSVMGMGGVFAKANAAAGNAQIWFWRGNGIIATGPGGIYPIGSVPIKEAANFPAGINYLLSSEPQGPVSTPTAPYNKYLVTGSTVRLRLLPINDTANPQGNVNALMAVLCPLTLDEAMTPTTFDTITLSEQPHAKKWIIPQVQTGNPINLKHHISTSEAMGGRPVNTALDDYYGSYNSNPTNSFNWVLMVSNVDGSGYPISYDVEVECDYHTTFFDRNVFSNAVPAQLEYAANGNQYVFYPNNYVNTGNGGDYYGGNQVAGGTLYDIALAGPSGPIIQNIYLGTQGASGPSGPFGYYARGNFPTTYVGTA